MRLDTHSARVYLVQQLEQTPGVQAIRYEDEDCIFVELKNQQSVLVHLFDREIPLTELRALYNANYEMNAHTLPMFLCHWVVPENGARFTPPDWFYAVHTLMGGKIYAYECDGIDTFIYPVQFRRQKRQHQVLYGEPINRFNLQCSTVNFQYEPLEGSWQIADFTGQPYEAPEPEPIVFDMALAPYYHILGLDYTADVTAIRQAYRQLARQYHPDVNQSSLATSLMQNINEAYQYLLRHFESNQG
jgi:hypothetical protein